ncbi:MAG TPA: LPS assembly lipoprotein LptE [Novosphingobium sp.]|nr:LPS assembly lipoprotein LptE [Novosphingobium sp.]
MGRLRALALAVLAAPALLLGGCGLTPLYSGGTAGVAQRGLSGIMVPAIPGQNGWLLHNALVDQIPQPAQGSARYRLDVKLDDRLEGLGLLSNDTVGRERRTLRARYQLVDLTNDEVVLDATAGSDAGLDVVSSEYATVAAEQTALENLVRVVSTKIVTNLAVQMRAMAKDKP